MDSKARGGTRGFDIEKVSLGLSLSGYERDALYLNLQGKHFLDISGITSADSISDGRGAVYADFDNDGDTDILLLATQGETHFLYRNEIGSRANFLRVTLEGLKAKDAFGAVVRVKSSAGIQTKIKNGGEGYQTQHDPRLLFGLGSDRSAEWVEVTWPSGLVQRLGPPAARSSNLIREGKAPEVVAEKRSLLGGPLVAGRGADLSVIPKVPQLKIQVGDRWPAINSRQIRSGQPASIPPSGVRHRQLVALWATWCAGCRQDLNVLAEQQNLLRNHGVEVTALNVMDDPAVVERFLKETALPLPVTETDEAALKTIYRGLDRPLPVSFLIGESGVIEKILVGSRALDRYVKKCNAGRG